MLSPLRRLSQSITIRTLFLTVTLFAVFLGSGYAYIQWRGLERTEWSPPFVESRDMFGEDRNQPPAEPIDPKLTTRVHSFTRLKTLDEAQQKAAQVSFLGAASASKAATLQQVEIYELSYDVQQTGLDWITQSARVYIPRSRDGQSPVFVFAAGTSGLSDACAPSREQVQRANIGNYENHMITQATQDYISVLPDYEGFNDTQKLQPYFVADSEARTMLGAVQALEQLAERPELGAMQADQLFLTGYSQGGHAALAAANRWDMIETEFTLQGVVGYGPAFDVFDIFRDIPQLAPYLVLAYAQEYPGEVEVSQLLQTRWVENIPAEAQSFCIDRALKFYPNNRAEVYTPSFAQSISTENLAGNFSGIAELLRRNTVFEDIAEVPILILQGKQDPLVTVVAQAENRQSLCQAAATVEYKEYPHTNHFQTRAHSFFDSLAWTESRVAGARVTGNCSEILP